MNIKEMKTMSIKDLEEKINLFRDEYTKTAFEANLQKKAEKPHKFKLLKRQIARAKTVIKQKQIEGV